MGHRGKALTALFAAICAASFPGVPADAWPWADSVTIYNPGPGYWQYPYRDETRALGRPWGAGPYVADNSSVITLGDRLTLTDPAGNVTARLGTITLDFGDRVLDDRRNPHGLDFIVFSNAIWTQGDPEVRYQEPAFVEVSEDGVNWFLILPNILPGDLKGAPQEGQDTGTSTTALRGYAEYTPTLPLPAGTRAEEFYTVPDRPSFAGDPESLLIDEGSGGGDAMDIAWAVQETSPGVPRTDAEGRPIPANLDSIRHVRITDAVSGDYQDPLYEISAEIDAVASVIPHKQPLSEALREPDGVIVRFDDAVVVRTGSDSSVAVHSADGSAGTRIAGSGSHPPGTRLSVLGRLYHRTDATWVTAIYCDPMGTAPVPRPVSASVRTLASRSLISPAGMVVQTWGRVHSKGYSGRFDLLDADGSMVIVYTSFGLPAEGSFVRVTGASRAGTSQTVIYTQTASDVEVVAPK